MKLTNLNKFLHLGIKREDNENKRTDMTAQYTELSEFNFFFNSSENIYRNFSIKDELSIRVK